MSHFLIRLGLYLQRQLSVSIVRGADAIIAGGIRIPRDSIWIDSTRDTSLQSVKNLFDPPDFTVETNSRDLQF